MDLEEALAKADVSAEETEICTIDNGLRTITIPSGLQTVGVESDEDVRRLYFQMPKQYHEVDLSGFNIRINFMNANNSGDVYAVTDKAISGDNITFSWLVGRNALAYKGNIRFIVCLKKTDAEGVVQKEFNTTLAQLTVLEGLETTEQVIQENPDIIEQILVRLDDLEENGGGGGTTNYNNLSNQPQINGVTLSGNKTSEDLHLQPAGSYITKETDPTVPDWAKEKAPDKTLTQEGKVADAKEVGDRIVQLSDDIANKEASGTAESKITAHNTSTDAHNDIRLLIQNLINTVTTLLDSDDETLDQTSEIVAYIKSNKSLIDAITTSKVSVSDIIDNLTTNVANKPLSASQGVALKGLIDALRTELDGIIIPTKLPNPNSLKIVYGGQEYSYDGSETKEIVLDSASIDEDELNTMLQEVFV